MSDNKEELKKYITINEGMDYRRIAKVMTQNNHKMNHATARNQLISAVEELLTSTASDLGMSLSADEISSLAKNQEIHEALQDVIYLAYEQSKKTQ